MEEFLERTVARLKKDCPRRFKELRQSCDSFFSRINNNGSSANGNGEGPDSAFTIEPLILACETHHPRLMEVALEGFHFMIDHGFLNSLKEDRSVSDTEATTLGTAMVEAICKCSEEYDETVQLQVIKTLLVAVTSLQFEIHDANLLLAVRACFQIHLTSKNSVIKTTAKAALTQMISIVFQRMESYDSRNSVSSPNNSADDKSELAIKNVFEEAPQTLSEVTGNSSLKVESFDSPYQKDAYLLFRALCKLSTKGFQDESAHSTDAVIHQNKVLSLELILVLLRNCGPLFKSSQKFINAVKTFLCNSLLSNCTSSSSQVTGLALQIFVLLVQDFKVHLKAEMEVFISSIFIRIIESEYSTYDHKARVLEVLHLIFADPQAQLELFVNYDCDLNATNIFSRIVTSLARLAKNPGSFAGKSPSVEFISSSSKRLMSEEGHLRSMGLDGLVIMLRSLQSLENSNVGLESSEAVVSTELKGENENKSQLSSDVLPDSDGTPSPAAPAHLTSLSVDDQTVQNIGIDVFDKKIRLERDLEMGILNFNLSPLKGLKFLASKGIITLEPFAIAHFLTEYNNRLDKTSVGDFLGREKEYENGLSYAVLHEFVKLMDFSDMDFVSAIRMFLSGFRLPGEAQKIDRIMEKFAEKYFLQHKEDFANADMAFILSFSTIMLQTNLHNPAVKEDKRMTKEQFIRQNKGISADGELSDELLSEIYDKIAAEPISLQADNNRKTKKDESSFTVFSGTGEKKKKDAFNSERKEMMRQSEALIRQKKSRASVFVKNVSINDDVYVKSMFEVVWPPVLGAISFILDSEEDQKLLDLSLSAFDLCISLACKLDFPIARNTFVNALTKFTALDTVKEMRGKQIACIRLMLNVAINWGDYLEESWNQILLSFSHLARLQLFAHGQNDDPFQSDFSVNGNNRRSSKPTADKSGSVGGANYSDSVAKFFMGMSKAESVRIIEEANAGFVAQHIDPELLDRIFLGSTKLSGPSVQHFVRSLCLVSLQEISSTTNAAKAKETGDYEGPRIFSLQKLVEVADSNMTSRSRVDWANIWNLLAKHFTSVGLHENMAVAMYAIDSLKQLSIKFLQKEELSNFNFQRLFLRPFETILSKTSSTMIKDLVLHCIDIMIKACAQNIRSGWRTIFSSLEVAAGQEEKEIAQLSFTILEGLLLEKFEMIKHDFVELMNCLVGFASCQHNHLSLKSISDLIICADHLAAGRINPTIEQHSASDTRELSWDSYRNESVKKSVDGEQSSVFRLWWPLLLGLSTRVADVRPSVRNEAFEALKCILTDHGGLFSIQTWAVIFKGVLFPIIDTAKSEFNSQQKSTADKQSWIENMAEKVLTFSVDCYLLRIRDDVTKAMFKDLLQMLNSCITLCIPSLSATALRVLHGFVLKLSGQASMGSKECLIDAVDSVHVDIIVNQEISLALQCIPFEFLQTRDISSSLPHRCSSSVATTLLGLQKTKYGQVETSFGRGRVVKVTGTPSHITKMLEIELDWNATLYAPSETVTHLPDHLDLTAAEIEKRFDVLFPVMKEILHQVVALLDETMLLFQIRLNDKQFDGVLNSLEGIYWYSYIFNRETMRGVSFDKLGHLKSKALLDRYLGDVELVSMQTILKWVFALYLQGGTMVDSSCEQRNHRLRRIVELVHERYDGSNVNPLTCDSDDDEDEEVFVNDDSMLSGTSHSETFTSLQRLNHSTYIACIKIILGAMLEFSLQQFQEQKSWFLDRMAGLITSDNLEIRILLRKIYRNYVHKILLKN